MEVSEIKLSEWNAIGNVEGNNDGHGKEADENGEKVTLSVGCCMYFDTFDLNTNDENDTNDGNRWC